MQSLKRKKIISEQDCLREFYASFEEKQRMMNKWRIYNLSKRK
ncbi:MAG: hypothetical protein ACXAEX_16425 [Promethearchaeota archaeon]